MQTEIRRTDVFSAHSNCSCSCSKSGELILDATPHKRRWAEICILAVWVYIYQTSRFIRLYNLVQENTSLSNDWVFLLTWNLMGCWDQGWLWLRGEGPLCRDSICKKQEEDSPKLKWDDLGLLHRESENSNTPKIRVIKIHKEMTAKGKGITQMHSAPRQWNHFSELFSL